MVNFTCASPVFCHCVMTISTQAWNFAVAITKKEDPNPTMPGMSLIASLCKAKSPRGLLQGSKLAKRMYSSPDFPVAADAVAAEFYALQQDSEQEQLSLLLAGRSKALQFLSIHSGGGNLSGFCQVLRTISFAHEDVPPAGTARLCEFRESPKVGPRVKANLSLGAESLRLKYPSVMLLHLGHEQADRHLCIDALTFDGRRLNILRGGVRSHTDFRLVFAVPSWGMRTVASRQRGDSLVRD
jgi:hypothetical protein